METSYYITEDAFHPESKLIHFEGKLIGFIYPCKTEPGYLVKPSFGSYTGFFKTLEKATIELVFHYWAQSRTVPFC